MSEESEDAIEYLTMNDPDNGAVQGFYCKGWIQAKIFADAINRGEDWQIQPSQVRHTYLRYGVASYDGDPQIWLFEYDKPGKGRFQATVAYTEMYG